ncbi:mucin-5AC-like [Musca vetustissima]|uniref:mucin-5AC-like n=1 Tax=Musca vetustissima TaxID=27455 RepID=UPI002AB60E72|nr:mucin-5AC-like [Musca vetustissima]
MTNTDAIKSATPKSTLGKRAAKKIWKLLTVNTQPDNGDGGGAHDIPTTTPARIVHGSKACRDMTSAPVPDTFVNDKASTISLSTKYSSTNSSSTLDSNSQKSVCTLNEAAKLFPRNMPSIRRSRRRLQQNGGSGTQRATSREKSATGTAAGTTAKAIFNASQKSAFARVSQTHSVPTINPNKSLSKKSKTNCSKHHRTSNTASKTTAVTQSLPQKKCSKTSQNRINEKSSNKKLTKHQAKIHHATPSSVASAMTSKSLPQPQQTKLTPKLSQTHYQCTGTRTSSSTSDVDAMHSQQSSLISYDLSCTTSQQSIITNDNSNVGHKLVPNMSDDTILSSGISCPSETHSEASATDSPTFHQTPVIHQTVAKAFQYNQRHNLVMDDNPDEDALISLELEMITGRCAGEQDSSGLLAKNTIATSSSSSSSSSPSQTTEPSTKVLGLQNLNRCRNRNAVWMHATVSDDQQLSDIEEQLQKIQITPHTGICDCLTHHSPWQSTAAGCMLSMNQPPYLLACAPQACEEYQGKRKALTGNALNISKTNTTDYLQKLQAGLNGWLAGWLAG